MDIRFQDAGVVFDGRAAVEPLTLTLTERRIGIIGLNGSGKTTFARMINGLTKPTSGHVSINGLDTVKDASEVLKDVGFIFQNPQNQIILPIIRDDVAFGLKNKGLKKAAVDAAVDAILQRFDIVHLAKRRAHELSGGELQLSALAALTITKPKILIMDEPTNQLDLKNRALVERTMAGLEQSLIVITHDLPLLESFDRVLLFHQGKLHSDASPTEAINAYRTLALS
ncbi:energy-coupling factor ABC transporter ATP-binding protein [Agrobacterium rubi]|uniref:energy-coupling factor ABC transporter ATP-binding protein n=1 Tax=Agrobacterium rubi TaxID=28099 RepID=UPI0015744561|nr:energy-coupling factor ABC transporter ATP-binding protein [Agrobacterium rubi]NTF06633.1 energy-coupling factor ABC transporter ATP-binding protein [Agrobacterium rubi]NTF18875.1 energy-coupling factor ABC transporter ATP-binding protein [Agrobacterium rubi]NTF25838.1 energy-coupling factor ABC transporter ATP-binding protein [Agrobacterium rubi]